MRSQRYFPSEIPDSPNEFSSGVGDESPHEALSLSSAFPTQADREWTLATPAARHGTANLVALYVWELPDMMFTKQSGFLDSPSSSFGTYLYYRIHATSSLHLFFHDPPLPSDADIICGSSLSRKTEVDMIWIHTVFKRACYSCTTVVRWAVARHLRHSLRTRLRPAFWC